MPKQVRSKRSGPARVATKRAATKRAATPRAARAAQGQLEKGVREIEKAIADVQQGLARAERRIETDARQRIRGLQKEGHAHMRTLEEKRREATRLLGKLSAAAGESWEDITKTAQTMINEARTTAVAVVERFRNVLN